MSCGLLPVLDSGGTVGEAPNNELRVEDVNKVEADFVFDDDDAVPKCDADNQDITDTASDEGADLSILDFY